MTDCKSCPSKAACDKLGKQAFFAMLGECQNCKAMVRVGAYKYRNRNRAHSQIIHCKTTGWAAEPMMSVVYTKARCPICGAFPIRVLKWVEKS